MQKNRPPTPRISHGDFHGDAYRRGPGYYSFRPTGCDDWLLIYTEEGCGRLGTAADEVLLRPGDVILYAPHELQDYSTAPKPGHWHLLWAHFVPKPHWVAWLQWPVGEHGLKVLHLADSEIHREFRTALHRMVAQTKRPLPVANDLAVLALEEALLWAKLAAFQDKWVTMDDRVRRAINHLASCYREPFRMDTLARHCGISPSRLAHLFRDQTGTSPQRFLEKHRMQVATRLLRHTNSTIGEIAAEVGYDDPFYFSNRFRRFSGKSPQQFREKERR
jgi:AraC family transcriptional regulator of arabinose operon